MQEIKTTEEYQKEVEITEEEIESYSGCSERTQRCLTDCPWPFLLIFKIRETSNVLVRVTIGIGDDIHNSNAAALEVSLGFISFFITFFFVLA